MDINQSIPPPQTPYVIVDPKALQDETLASLAKEFVLREQGNDDGSGFDLEAAIERAQNLIKKGTLLITFDPETDSVGVIDRSDPAVTSLN